MRKSRFTESQIVGILKQGEEAGIPIAEILSQPNISKAAWHTRIDTAQTYTDIRLLQLKHSNPSFSPVTGSLSYSAR